MISSRDRRIAKELNDIRADKDDSGVYAYPPDEADLANLTGTFPGPPDTVYAGGKFEVSIKIPDTYPFKAPVMKLRTKIWHPNISSQTGAICLDTLSSNWSPVQTIKTALLSLRMLLEAPNPQDPQDAQVAKMLIEDPKGFAKIAHEWAVKYAGAPRRAEYDRVNDDVPKDQLKPNVPNLRGYNRNLVGRFTAMGFGSDAVVEALVKTKIETNRGMDYPVSELQMTQVMEQLLQTEQ